MSLTHIETIELGSSQSSITFSSIPQDYDDLVVVLEGRTTRTGTFGYVDDLDLNINSDGFGVNMSGVVLLNIPSVASITSDNPPAFTGAGSTSNTFGNSSLYISNYTASSAKSMSFDGSLENNSSSAGLGLAALLYNSTSAITSIEVGAANNDFDTGSTFSLFGITAGGDGTVTTS